MTSTKNDLAALGLQFRHTVHISDEAVRQLLLRYNVRCASRRGYVIEMDGWLVRLTDESGVWTAALLHIDPAVAHDPRHEHRITPIEGEEDVLTCVVCGSEW